MVGAQCSLAPEQLLDGQELVDGHTEGHQSIVSALELQQDYHVSAHQPLNRRRMTEDRFERGILQGSILTRSGAGRAAMVAGRLTSAESGALEWLDRPISLLLPFFS